jgi:hypothetical protein
LILRELVAALLTLAIGTPTLGYDAVGNRTQKTSTLPGYPGGLLNYNANDQLATDTYDANAITTASTGLGYAYDFENQVIQAGAGISIVYDGDGNRVSKTVNGITTTYLVDTQNPTGYVQVLLESFGGNRGTAYEITHTYVSLYGCGLCPDVDSQILKRYRRHLRPIIYPCKPTHRTANQLGGYVKKVPAGSQGQR